MVTSLITAISLITVTNLITVTSPITMAINQIPVTNPTTMAVINPILVTMENQLRTSQKSQKLILLR